MRQRSNIFIVAAVCALFVAPPAFAGTASVSGGTLTFAGGAGEANDLELTADAAGTATLHDSWHPIVAGAGCTQSGADAICTGAATIVVALGDGDDTFTSDSSSALPLQVDGGAGSDELYDIPGAQPQQYFGGDGNDLLSVDGAPIGADSFSGGAGEDAVDYWARGTAVSISLDDIDNDGAAGEHDNVRSDVEELIGGDGADTITGGAGDDWLAGGPGADVLRGGAGSDDILGEDGADDIDGGAGDDAMDGGAGADVMRGGGGGDIADYSGRSAPLRVDLDDQAGDDGESGEGDTVTADVEAINGGSGDDVLTGNALDGYLDGGAGNDTLTDAGGADFLYGGDGNDVIDAVDTAPDQAECGAGTDQLRADPVDGTFECEQVSRVGGVPGPDLVLSPGTPTTIWTPSPYPPPPPPPGPIDYVPATVTVRVAARPRSAVVSKSGLVVTVRCNEPCKVTGALAPTAATAHALKRKGVRVRGPLARASATTLAREHKLKLRFTSVGRTALRKVPAGTYTLSLRIVDAAGNPTTGTKKVTLRR